MATDALVAAHAEVEEWEAKALAAEKRGDDTALRYCLAKWDQALDRREKAMTEAPDGA